MSFSTSRKTQIIFPCSVLRMNATSCRTPSLSSVWKASSLRRPSSSYHSRRRSDFPSLIQAVERTKDIPYLLLSRHRGREPCRCGLRNRIDEDARVFVLGRVEDALGRPRFDDGPAVEHVDTVGDLAHDSQV